MSSSSPDVKKRVSSEPMTVDAGSEAATECRLGRWRPAEVLLFFDSNGREEAFCEGEKTISARKSRDTDEGRMLRGDFFMGPEGDRQKSLGSVKLRLSWGRSDSGLASSGLDSPGKGVDAALLLV